MSTTIHSLPPEVVLQILDHLAPIKPGDPGGKAALLAASLVDRRLGQLAQQVLFHSVYFERRSHARRWRETGAGVHTREMTIAFWPGYIGGDAGKAHRPVPLAELFALSEAHSAAGGRPRITTLDVKIADDSELAGSLIGVEMLEGLGSLHVSHLHCRSAFEPFFSRLRGLYVNLFDPDGPVLLSPGAFPHLTHLGLFHPPLEMDMLSFPSLRSSTIDCFGSASLDPLISALAAAPPSLTRFATRARLPLAVLEALPATITELVVTPTVVNELQHLLYRWFSDRDSAEVGRLRRLVVLGMSEQKVASHYTLGTQFLERVRKKGCEVECRQDYELEWRA